MKLKQIKFLYYLILLVKDAILPLALIYGVHLFVGFKATVFVAAMFLIFFITHVRARNKMLFEWARDSFRREFNDDQRIAMIKLWAQFKFKETPSREKDSLATLSSQDILAIKKFCSMAYRPKKFSGGVFQDLTVFYSSVLSLKERGFNDDQAEILSGMILNRYSAVIEDAIKN